MAIRPGDKFEPPYVGSYNEGVHGEGSRVRGKGVSEYERFPFSDSRLTDPPCPVFTHWKRRGTRNPPSQSFFASEFRRWASLERGLSARKFFIFRGLLLEWRHDCFA